MLKTTVARLAVARFAALMVLAALVTSFTVRFGMGNRDPNPLLIWPERLSPAVVNISTSQKVQRGAGNQPQAPNLPEGLTVPRVFRRVL